MRAAISHSLERKRTRRLAARSIVVCFEMLEQRRFLSSSTPANIQITDDPGAQNQPSVAVDPAASKHIAVAYLDKSLLNTGYTGIGIASSIDGGKTWTHSSIPLAAGFNEGAAYPIAKFDADGHLFVSFMAVKFLRDKPPITDSSRGPEGQTYFLDLFTSNNGIFVARSDDDGMTWSTPVAVSSHMYNGTDKVIAEKRPDIAIDTFRTLPNGKSNPNFGNMYVVFSRFYPPGQYPGEPDSTGGSSAQVAVSTDGGASFEVRQPAPTKAHPVPISVILNKDATGKDFEEGLGNVNFVHVGVGPQGDIYVSYYDFDIFPVVHSTDAGRTFTVPDYTIPGDHQVFASYAASGYPFASQPAGPDARFARASIVRAIAVDPTRPGTVYAEEVVDNADAAGELLDSSDVFFSRSTDYGATWDAPIKFDPQVNATLLNDDNDGLRSTGSDSDVTAKQFLARLAIDAKGNLAAIWYDTRRDPANNKIDVFGTVSVDGGETFSPNFRITRQAFDPNDGKFTDALGQDNYFLGDYIGLTVDDGSALAVWTDTRGGNQDLFLSRFSVNTPPPSANDRFEPNDNLASATDLGDLIQQELPKLRIGPGDTDLFRFRSPATGKLALSASESKTGGRLNMELLDATSGDVLSEANNLISFPSEAGHEYILRISGTDNVATRYSLSLQNLSGNLGPVVERTVKGALSQGDEALYLAQAAASGSLQVRLIRGDDASGDFTVELLDSKSLQPLASGSASTSLVVQQGEQFLISVRAADGESASGSFQLRITNLDQFSVPGQTSLLFPAGNGPGQVATADLNHDGKLDLVVSNIVSNTVSSLLGNGDGTFQSPRQFADGASQGASNISSILNGRGIVTADFDGDGNPDVAVTNPASADVSVLLGRGDGTFQPQRRFDATSRPWSLDAGDLNGDGIADLAVIDDPVAGHLSIAILLSRGDGTFRHEAIIQTPDAGGTDFSNIKIADINDDRNEDILYNGAADGMTHILLGQGNGEFTTGSSFVGGGPGLAIADLNGDGKPDVINADYLNNIVSYALGNGDGTFIASADGESFFGGESPLDVAVEDIASVEADGNIVLGTPDGIPDIISEGSGVPQATFHGPPAIMVSVGQLDPDTHALSYTDAEQIASGDEPISLTTGDVNGDHVPDILVTDAPGVRAIFATPLTFSDNATRDTARDLGTVVHVVQPTLTIVPGHEDAWFSFVVPTESALNSDNEVVDLSAGFAQQLGAGLEMELSNSAGDVLATGEHIRISAAQGEKLFVHVFGRSDSQNSRGNGAYTLDLAMLPQLISVQAPPLLVGAGGSAGGASASIVLTFQGDRLDPSSAQDAANYTVTWLGKDGVLGGGDDQDIPIDGNGAQPVVYDPGVNVDVATGITYATAVKQTVTLLFNTSLPAGSYRIQISPSVKAAAVNDSEIANDHPNVQALKSGINDGADVSAHGLVTKANTAIDFSAFTSGTPFLSQLQGDLGALLDQNLSAGQEQKVTDALISQLESRLSAGVRGASTSLLALFLDPVSLDLQDPAGERVNYNLTTGDFSNAIPNAYVSVASNVELVVIPLVSGDYDLNVSDVPANARGGAIVLRDGEQQSLSFTDGLRASVTDFLVPTGSSHNAADLQTEIPPAPPVQSVNFVTPTRVADSGTFAAHGTLALARHSSTSPPRPRRIIHMLLPKLRALDIAAVIREFLDKATDLLKPLLNAPLRIFLKAQAPAKPRPSGLQASTINTPVNKSPSAGLPHVVAQRTAVHGHKSSVDNRLQKHRWSVLHICAAIFAALNVAALHLSGSRRNRRGNCREQCHE
jgi:hypothetical protein